MANTAAPGQVLVAVTTVDQLRMRTKDLIDPEAARVAVDQPGRVVLDAPPDTPP
ncbi:MAG: hypothetical protein PVF54_08340 [Anaerolineae bacterium]